MEFLETLGNIARVINAIANITRGIVYVLHKKHQKSNRDYFAES